MDGDPDLGAVSFIPTEARARKTFVYFENQGQFQISGTGLFPEVGLGRWMVMDAEDMDGDGDEDIVLGPSTSKVTTVAGDHRPMDQGRCAVLVLEEFDKIWEIAHPDQIFAEKFPRNVILLSIKVVGKNERILFTVLLLFASFCSGKHGSILPIRGMYNRRLGCPWHAIDCQYLYTSTNPASVDLVSKHADYMEM
ncbi:MAG: VCBS repeat-containing protein [Bacteroidetes bacterium]|nr:VCBS repeat-containing protein [Bacteroidota bacterium]